MKGMLIPTNGNPVESSEDGRVTLKGEAQASRAASEKLAEGRDTGSPALDDHSIV